MAEAKETDTSKISLSQKTEDTGLTSKDNLSIQQILEGMTNEFNKTGSKKQETVKKIINKVDSSLNRKQEKFQSKIVKETAVTNSHQCIQEEKKIVKENIPEKKTEVSPKDDKETSSPRQETNGKKDTPPRIVLTFRTINENTNYGKKTKISSCPSNLTLVPDEFSNCDQIGGVSVKIENFDEVCNNDNKEDNQIKSLKRNKSPDRNNKNDIEENHTSDSEDKTNLSTESGESSSNVENKNDNGIIKDDKPLIASPKETTKVGKTKAVKRQTSVVNFSIESALKRSARRLSKDTTKKSTVLENAMARKEKSNYVTETVKRKNNKPGRPKKPIVEKKTTIPKLNPLGPPPKLTPIEPLKLKTTDHNKKDNIPDLNPINLPNSVGESKKSISPPKQIQDKKDNMPNLKPLVKLSNSISDGKDNSSIQNYSLLKPIVNTIENATNSSPKFNKFSEMPKLTPIFQNNDLLKFDEQQTSNLNSKSESLLKNSNDNDDAFLKPPQTKLKRDRTESVNKKNVSTKDSSSSSSEIMDDTPSEENLTPVKKKRKTSNSISPKARSIKKSETSLQCLCEIRSQLFVTITSVDAPLFCTANDSVDNRVVSCSNEVDQDDVAMRRPSAHIPYIILCRMHKERLIRHNCCPTCGLFCLQGEFVHCSNGHQYHRDCEMFYEDKPLCPHCASYNTSYDVYITLTGKRKMAATKSPTPPKQSPTAVATITTETRKEPAARITLPGSGDNAKLAEQKPIQKKSNEPLIDPELIKIPESTVVDKTERYSVISLYNAVKNGDLQKLVNVLAFGINANHVFRDEDHQTSLHIAADEGNLACVHVLVQAGAQLDVLDSNQMTPLILAAINGNADVVRYLMKIGADVTLKGEDGMTALHMASKFGHLDVCQIILNECKVPRTLVDSVDDGGWTSLIWACEFRHVEVAKFLLEKKCDPLIRDAEQNIALHWSAFSGCHEITEILIDLGCDINVVNIHGDTPLHIASRCNQYSVCVLLLSRGAKIGEKNNLNETAIDCCPSEGDTLNVLKLNFRVNQQSENLNERTNKILSNDITRGKETNPVQCVNDLDSEEKPTDFVYITENCFTIKINVDRTITSLQSCFCEDNCHSENCLCGNISLRCWYNEEGKLVPEFNYSDPPMLFECNPACDCNKISCNNRVVQHGMTQRFQLFRTKGKGWGLRTLRLIPKGTYVCEYVGELITDFEADKREDDSYLFDLDNRDGQTYCIDARRYGNLARFINHSCSPNLLPVRVFIEHQDLRFPRIAFFANRDIEANEELGFDYGEKFWIIKHKSFTCTCNAENCRYSEKTIKITLENYRQRIQAQKINAGNQQSSTV